MVNTAKYHIFPGLICDFPAFVGFYFILFLARYTTKSTLRTLQFLVACPLQPQNCVLACWQRAETNSRHPPAPAICTVLCSVLWSSIRQEPNWYNLYFFCSFRWKRRPTMPVARSTLRNLSQIRLHHGMRHEHDGQSPPTRRAQSPCLKWTTLQYFMQAFILVHLNGVWITSWGASSIQVQESAWSPAYETGAI